MNQTKKKIEFFEGRKKTKHKKQHYVESSSEDSESECYIPKKKKAKKTIKDKRSYNEDENDYDNVDRAVENSEESENVDEDEYDDDENEYDIDYKRKTNQIK